MKAAQLQTTKVIYRTQPLSKRMGEALGILCSRFALLEWNVDRTIWALMGKDRKQGRHLTQHLLNDARIKRLRKEANNRFGPSHPSALYYNQVADGLKSLCRQRNLYVHGMWSKGKSRGTRQKQYVLSYFKTPGGYSEEVNLSQLQHFAELVLACKGALEHASEKHIGCKLP
jgi:hypothetical protein